MKGEEITIKIGAWLIEQAAKAVPDVASDVDPRIHRNIKAMNAAKNMKKKEEPDAEPTTKVCPFCLSEIDIKATRCPHCTSELKE